MKNLYLPVFFTALLFVLFPVNSAFAWGDSANGGGFNGGCIDRGTCGENDAAEANVCVPKPTKVTKCESGEYHPLTLRCLSEEVVNHPNGYFFTNDEVCIPSINGAKTHCTKMPAWDGCSREKKLKDIGFKIPAAFPVCYGKDTTGAIGQSSNWGSSINQNQAYLQASASMCSCFNNSIAQIRDLIKDHPVEKDEDISKKISELLNVAKQCRDISSTVLDRNLGCSEGGTCISTNNGGASASASGEGTVSGASRASGISGQPSEENLGAMNKAAGQTYRESGISLAPSGGVGSFAKDPVGKKPDIQPDEEYTWGKGGSGERSPASAAAAESSLSGGRDGGSIEIGSHSLRDSKDTLPDTVKRDGLSNDILEALDRKGMTDQTLFQIVNRKYRSRHYELVKPKW